MSVFFLISTKPDGEEINEGIFTDTDDLIDHLYANELIEVLTNGDKASVALVSEVRIKLVDLGLKKPAPKTFPSQAPVARPIDDPDFWVEVPSEAVVGLKYSVGIRGKQIVSCSCPDFVERRKYVGDNCKHMRTVFDYPYRFNVQNRVQSIGRLTDVPKEV
jgi:hypothetical protein